jgi:hypothetical protein
MPVSYFCLTTIVLRLYAVNTQWSSTPDTDKYGVSCARSATRGRAQHGTMNRPFSREISRGRHTKAQNWFYTMLENDIT